MSLCGKIVYATRELAEAAAALFSQRAYRCDRGPHWHTSSKTEWQESRKKAIASVQDLRK